MLSLTDKVAIETGASRGIGKTIAETFANAGAHVVCAARSTEAIQAGAREINSNGASASHTTCDISDKESFTNLVQTTVQEHERLDILVNNAGVNGSGSRVEDLDVDASRRVFEVNVLGTFLCAKYAVKRMAKRHGGSGGVIVNVSSAASKHGGPGTYTDYAASKGAIDTFTVGLAKEQAEEGIRVNCLRPGATMTELSVDWAKQNPQWLDWVIEQLPMSRPAQVEEIARVAIFLLSDDSSYVTGATLDVCGGWVSP